MALHIAVKKEEQVEVVIQPEIVSAPKTKEAELVDVLVSLWERYEAFDMKETTKQMEAVKKQLQEIANENYDSKEMVVLNGEKGQVVFSPRTEPVEVINSQELFHLLISKFGAEAAFSTVKFSITDLKNLLSPNELELFTKKVSGSRTMKAVLPVT